MTISTISTVVKYLGNDTTTVFAVPFEFFDGTDLYVKLYPDIVGDPDTFINPVYGIDYTVTGGDGTTGQVTMLVAPAAPAQLEILGNLPVGQVVAYSATGPFPAEAHENALDRLSIQIKQIATNIAFSPGTPPGGGAVTSVFGRDGVVVAQQADYSFFYSLTTHQHQWSEILGKPTLFPPSSHTHEWVDIQSKPVVFPPEAHTHVWGEITNAIESAQDLVGAMFVHAGNTGIEFSYNDASGEIFAVVTGGGGGGSTANRNYNFDGSTVMADPGVGDFRMNSAAFLTVTELVFSDVDQDGLIPNWGNAVIGDILTFANKSQTGYARYTITLVDTTGTGFFRCVVTVDPNNTTSTPNPVNNNDFTITIYKASEGITEAPDDGNAYVRKSIAWTPLAWVDIDGTPATFPPNAHNHTIAEVTGLQSALDGKTNVGHTHTISNITGLDTALAGKLDLTGGSLSGPLTLPSAAPTGDQAVPKSHLVSTYAPLASPALTGNPVAPTPASGDNDTSIATTAFVQDAVTRVIENNQGGTAYTLLLTDAGKMVQMNNAAPFTLTIPAFTSVAFQNNVRIDLLQGGAGQVTVVPAATVTILSSGNKTKLTGQYSGATLWKVSTNIWVLIGDIAA
jgi:hypothetical protein